VPKDFGESEEYDIGFKVDELMEINNVGIATGKDSELVSISPTDIFEKYKIIAHAYSYRPFDIRYTAFDNNLLQRARFNVMKHMTKENISLQVTSKNRQLSLGYVFVSKTISDRHLLDSAADSMNSFPLYLYDEDNVRTPNLNKKIVAEIENIVGETTPEDIFDYIYATLHSPSYREKYKEFLKIDFPRVPYPHDKESFKALVSLGAELRLLHLMESPKLGQYITTYPEAGSDTVENITYKNERVIINCEQYFGNVPELAWNFCIGGYQPAQKWLKDRKGRTLTNDDIDHYQKMIVALVETNRIMGEIQSIEGEH
jgi:predicted helicase